MRSVRTALRQRLIPAVLTAVGVTLLAAGLLDVGSPALAQPEPSRGPTTPATSDGPAAYLPPSFPPLEVASEPPATPTPTPDPDRVATRVVIEALDIYVSIVNNDLSRIMKRLTGVTVILAGIGAVAGIFGMSEAGTAFSGAEATGFWIVTIGVVLLAIAAAAVLRRFDWI
jgi:hypothetical protein